MVTRC